MKEVYKTFIRIESKWYLIGRDDRLKRIEQLTWACFKLSMFSIRGQLECGRTFKLWELQTNICNLGVDVGYLVCLY